MRCDAKTKQTKSMVAIGKTTIYQINYDREYYSLGLHDYAQSTQKNI